MHSALNDSESYKVLHQISDLDRLRSEDLLSKMFPERVYKEMVEHGSVKPRLHQNVTIFMSDIEGFTKLCSDLDPYDVFKYLNKVYVFMDYVLSKFPSLYKVETIGDAYVVCGGLDSDMDANIACCSIADFALIIQSLIEMVEMPVGNDVTRPPTRIRVGLNSGDIVSGIVGLTMPRYCLFGSTINIASRMESTSKVELIHLSQATASLLASTGKYIVEERGEVEVKGAGVMQTSWLKGASARHEFLTVGYINSMRDDGWSKIAGLSRSHASTAFISSLSLSSGSGLTSIASICTVHHRIPSLLVIDDNLVVRKWLTKKLSTYFTVDVAISGDDAISKITNKVNDLEKYDIIVLDFDLRDMTGVDVINTLIKEEVPLPEVIIGLTGKLNHLNELKLVASMTACFCKPVKAESIISAYRLHKARKQFSAIKERAADALMR